MSAARAIQPRLLTAEQAAQYLGGVPVAEVERQAVGRVRWGRSWRYDRFAIDRKLDELAGLKPATPPEAETVAENDAEAALARFQARRGEDAPRSA